ncbi:MAG TPA: His-Xaa-Ser system radical SAM maturase HxsB [Arachidicoccus sp.]|nr:His-Xaa-Ser system radical SAM maturase HxsB [Arachidicoccus sp.]
MMDKIINNQNKNRKFKEYDSYDLSLEEKYYLLPFRFLKINPRREVLVNDVGDFLIVPIGTASNIITRNLHKKKDKNLYSDLIANFFISEQPIPELINIIATRYRTKKSFLDQFTSLHIFVITLRCGHTCHYCQVSRVSANKENFDMKLTHIAKGIDLMMRSPAKNVTMEFQGGESLLAFDNIKAAIELTKKQAKLFNKNTTFVICTNLAPITDEILNYCLNENILISTSLDGPEFIHNKNRHKIGNDSYKLAINGINKCRTILGGNRVSALLTTTTFSLNYPTEIVNEYFEKGFKSIFLRPISPFGFANYNKKKNNYQMDQFLEFYKIALSKVIEYNLSGYYFREEYATIILKKILTPFPVGYVDLQSPSGIVNNVIVFNYDGKIYASDESRMLAEDKDFTFQLGDLDHSTYEDIFYGDKIETISKAMVNEGLAGCSECALQSYCGADPVLHYAVQNDMYGYRPTSPFCQKNMEIIRHLFELMDNDERIETIFRNWANL